MITLESLLNNEESNINEEISLEDYSFDLSDYTIECSDIMCDINTLEAASIVCEDENKKNIFKQMIEKIKKFFINLGRSIKNFLKFIIQKLRHFKDSSVDDLCVEKILKSDTMKKAIIPINDEINELSKRLPTVNKQDDCESSLLFTDNNEFIDKIDKISNDVEIISKCVEKTLNDCLEWNISAVRNPKYVINNYIYTNLDKLDKNVKIINELMTKLSSNDEESSDYITHKLQNLLQTCIILTNSLTTELKLETKLIDARSDVYMEISIRNAKIFQDIVKISSSSSKYNDEEYSECYDKLVEDSELYNLQLARAANKEFPIRNYLDSNDIEMLKELPLIDASIHTRKPYSCVVGHICHFMNEFKVY